MTERENLGFECAKLILNFFTDLHDDPQAGPNVFPIDLGEIYSTPMDLAELKPMVGYSTEGLLGTVYGIQVKLYMVVIRKMEDKIVIIEFNLLNPTISFKKDLPIISPKKVTD